MGEIKSRGVIPPERETGDMNKAKESIYEGRVSLFLEPREAFAIDREMKERWPEIVRDVPEGYSGGMMLLAEILSIFDEGLKAEFRCVDFSNPDMFGGGDWNWELRTPRYSLSHHLSQEIRESWSSLRVDVDKCRIPRLPFPMYFEWNEEEGALALVLGNIPESMAAELEKVTKRLFKTPGIRREPPRTRMSRMRELLLSEGLCLDPLKSSDPKANKIVATFLVDDERKALQAFEEVKEIKFYLHPGFYRIFPAVLEESSPKVRREVIDWLASTSESWRMELLRLALLDEHEDIRLAALEGLWKKYDNDSTPAILEAVTRRGFSPRNEAIKALARLANSKFSEECRKSLSPYLDDPDVGFRREVVRVMARFETPEMKEFFSAAIRDSDSLIRETGAWGLARIGDPTTRELLATLARDKDPEVAGNSVGFLKLLDRSRTRHMVQTFEWWRVCDGCKGGETWSIEDLRGPRREFSDEPASGTKTTRFDDLVAAIRKSEPEVLKLWVETHIAVCRRFLAETGKPGRNSGEDERKKSAKAAADLLKSLANILEGENRVSAVPDDLLRLNRYRFDLELNRCEPRPRLCPFEDASK